MEEVKARTSLENSFPPRYVSKIEYYVSVNKNTPEIIPTRKNYFLKCLKKN